MPSLTGSIVVVDLPSASVFVTADGNLPGFSLENVSKKTTAKSAGAGSWLSGLSVLNLATTSGCVFSQSSTYCCCGVGFLASKVVPTQAWAKPLCASAH